MAARGPTQRVRLRTREKAAKAVALRKAGMKLADIAKEIGSASKSGVHALIENYIRELGHEDAKALQKRMLGYTQLALDSATVDLADDDPKVRARAQSNVTQAALRMATIAGVVRLAPVIVAPPPAPTDAGFDIRQLPIEDIMHLRRIRMRMLGTVEAEGHEVTEPQPTEPKEEPHDGRDDSEQA